MTTRVLIADDHTIVREGLKRILAGDPGFALAGEAKDGHETLAGQGKFDNDRLPRLAMRVICRRALDLVDP